MAKLKWSIRQVDIETIAGGVRYEAQIVAHGFYNSGLQLSLHSIAKDLANRLDSPLVAAPAVLPDVEKVIYNPPATIVLWADKTKTVVKCNEDDIYSRNAGFAMACLKKALGDNYKKFFRTNELKIEKSCKKCKYKDLEMWELPCIECLKNSKWEAAECF